MVRCSQAVAATETGVKTKMFCWPRFCLWTLWRLLRLFLGFVCHLLYEIRRFRKLCYPSLAPLLKMAAIWRMICASCYFLIGRDRSLCRGSLFRPRSYFHVVKIYNFELLCRASVSFSTQASFSPNVLYGILAQNTFIGWKVLRWTEMTLHFLLKFPFAHLSLGLSPFGFVLCIVVEGMHSSNEQRPNRVGDYFRLLHVCVKKQCKCQKPVLALL